MNQHGWTSRRWAWAGLGALLSVATGLAQQPARTTVSDTIYRADGSPASGAADFMAGVHHGGHQTGSGRNARGTSRSGRCVFRCVGA